MWLSIAAQNGEEGAQQALAAIGANATEEQRQQARARAQEWLRAHPPR
jgi:hypothetical protein